MSLNKNILHEHLLKVFVQFCLLKMSSFPSDSFISDELMNVSCSDEPKLFQPLPVNHERKKYVFKHM